MVEPRSAVPVGATSTIHANTAEDALIRLATCALIQEGWAAMPWPALAAIVGAAHSALLLGSSGRGASDRAWSNEAAMLTARVVLSVRPYGATRAIVCMVSAIVSSLSRMRLPGQRSGSCHIPTLLRCHDACGLLACRAPNPKYP